MVLQGETIGRGARPVCEDCGTVLVNDVCRSAAGWYIGTMCDCGPYSRESGYFKTEEQAQQALDSGDWERR